MTSTTAPVIGFVAALPVFFAVWFGVTALLSSLSGWPRLAEAFPGSSARPAGEPIRGRVLGLGPIRENNVTILIPTQSGLYMYPMVLFRLRRAPVLLPWSRIRYLDHRQVLWSRYCVLDLAGLATMRVRPSLIPVLRSHGVPVPSDAEG